MVKVYPSSKQTNNIFVHSKIVFTEYRKMVLKTSNYKNGFYVFDILFTIFASNDLRIFYLKICCGRNVAPVCFT